MITLFECTDHGRPSDDGFVTYVAETRCRKPCDSSRLRTHAQSRAELESSRARVPNTAGGEISSTTLLRVGAHTTYWKCCLGAYGHHCHSRSGTPHQHVQDDVHTAIRPLPSRPGSTVYSEVALNPATLSRQGALCNSGIEVMGFVEARTMVVKSLVQVCPDSNGCRQFRYSVRQVTRRQPRWHSPLHRQRRVSRKPHYGRVSPARTPDIRYLRDCQLTDFEAILCASPIQLVRQRSMDIRRRPQPGGQ